MAKIITENFRTGITKDFFDSFINKNQIVIDNLVSGLRLSGFSNNEIELAQTGLETQLDIYLPETNYYIFASSIDKDSTIANSQVEKRDFLRRVIFGNKVDGSNIRYLFDKKEWIEGTVYDAFDDAEDISTLYMYVTVLDGDVNEGSYNVYKCLDNNGGSTSTSEPTFTTNEETRTADGYIWKYMFSVPPSEYITYQTTTALPYFGNASAVSAAVDNISDILIESVEDNAIFESKVLGTNIAVDGIEQVGSTGNYKVTIITDEDPSADSDAYKNMYIKFVNNEDFIFDITQTNKPGDTTNQLEVFFTSSIIFDENEINEIENDTVSIVPKIIVSPSDGGGDNCIAYGIIDSSGNLIDIQFVNRGSKYTYATAELALPPSMVDIDSSLRVVVSPKGGHASDPISELYMSKVIVNTSFFSTNLTNIPDSNTYTKIGIVKNPTFRDSTFPSDIDNRMALTANTDIRTDVIATNSYVYQTKSGGEVVEGRIHEILYDSDTDTTTIYLVDYTGDYNTTFEAGEANVKTEPDSLISNDFTINTVTPGNYVPYSGEIYHFVDFNPIERQPDTKEKVKFVFDF